MFQSVNIASRRNPIGVYIFQQKWLLLHYLLIIFLNRCIDIAQSFLSKQPQPPYLLIIGLDNFCHSVTSGLLWSSIEQKRFNDRSLSLGAIWNFRNWKKVFFDENRQFSERVIAAVFLGSIIDLDHFIAAKSLTIYAARHLSSRPFGHSVTFIVLSALFSRSILKLSILLSSLISISLFAHQLRDSIRRGLWFWPLGSSVPLSSNFVFLLMITTSLVGRHYLFRDDPQDLHDNQETQSLIPRRQREDGLVLEV